MFPKGNLIVKLIFFGVLALTGCSKKATVNSSGGAYNEDLARVRPKYEYKQPVIKEQAPEEPKKDRYSDSKINADELNVNKKLQTVLDTMAQRNKSIRYINGFRIQLYVGNIRSEADGAKSYIYQMFPDMNPYMSYNQPTYRVKAGDFIDRSDAEQVLEQIREQYPSATILSDKVDIKKSLNSSSSSDY